MFEYENTRRIVYGGGATFVPKCIKCGRFVKPNEVIRFDGFGVKDEPNAVCKRCGPVKMIFEGFFE